MESKPSFISSLITFMRAVSLPAATNPSFLFHEHAVIVALFGTEIFEYIESLVHFLKILF